MNSWLRTSALPSVVLALLYAFSGRLSFLTQVELLIVTPVFFMPEAFALAFALRFGPGIWPGVFVGQLLLALSRDLLPSAALAISAINSVEAILAVYFYRRMEGRLGLYDLRSWITFQGLVFLILQPFSATLGTLSLAAGGIIPDFPTWVNAWKDWWLGNSVAQSQLAPLVLLLLQRETRSGWMRKIFLPLLVTSAALWLSLSAFPAGSIGTSLVIFQPLLIGFGLALGLKATCAASVLISVSFLYATSHGIGPFYTREGTGLLDLNVFLVGISLIAQFLAVLFRQLEDVRAREQAMEKTQREEILRKLKTSLTAAGIAHEINQPLSQILLQSEVTLRDLEKDPAPPRPLQKALLFIRDKAEEMTGVIETIRALLGNIATGHQALDLTAVARSALLHVQPLCQRKQVQLNSAGLDQPCRFSGDDAQLQLLIVNLLRNALQAVEGLEPDRRKISLSLREEESRVIFSVEEAGPGFSEEQKVKSELPIESTKPEGMGMGLYLIRTAAENHGGTVSFSRSPALGGAKVEVVFSR